MGDLLPKKTVTQYATENLMNTPKETLNDWPFWFVFGALNAGWDVVFNVLPTGGSSLQNMIMEAIWRGARTTSEFVTWDGYGRMNSGLSTDKELSKINQKVPPPRS